MDSRRDHINPGPIDDSVLHLQAQHRSQAVWLDLDGAATTTIDCRRSTTTRPQDLDNMHPGVVQLLKQTGFYGLARIGFFQLDHHLITALVERWRPETHTFHLPEGECTITLQDIAIQTGLRIDGQPLIGRDCDNWTALCQSLLGVTPPAGKLRGQMLRSNWLVNAIPMPQADANEDTIIFYTRSYILQLVGGCLFCTKDTGRVRLQILPYLANLDEVAQFSWGSACLAYLFRELCLACRYPLVAQISGPLFILQVWAWDRFPFIAPSVDDIGVPYDAPLAGRWNQVRHITEVPTHTLVHIRNSFDTARQDDIVWEPYDDYMLQNLPAYCLSGRHIWSVLVPLICIHIIEWHPADRVMRQFGFQQVIPNAPLSIEHLHFTDLRSRQVNWAQYHAQWIDLWNQREQWVQRAPTGSHVMHYHSIYMEWYRRITRRWIGLQGASIGTSADAMEYMTKATNICDVRLVAMSSQRAIGEDRRMVTELPPEPSYHNQYLQLPPAQPKRRRNR